MRATALIAAIATAALVSPAFAAELSRTEYKAAVEPKCQKNTKANERIMKGVRNLVKRNKLKPAGAKFLKASAALKRTYRELKAVPQPSADEARLKKWLRYIATEANLFKSAGVALKQGKKGKAQRFVNKLTTNANKANAEVLAFGFRYCKFNPAKFT